MEYIARHADNVDREIEKLATDLPQTVPDDDESSQEWMHLLATIDTCAIPVETQFCDDKGYDIVPIRVATPMYEINSAHAEDSFDGKKMNQSSEQEASEEKAKCQAQKNRAKRRYINCISSVSTDGDCDPPLLVKLNVQGKPMTFFLDSGVDANILSYETFQNLKRECSKSSVVLTSFANTKTKAFGRISLKLGHGTCIHECTFYTAQPKESLHPAILGRA
ncbi:hypothetical protein L7F22_044617 [Adiantum nelumboides]|nr:hypothetical protein [Adiantum nelumboides]